MAAPRPWPPLRRLRRTHSHRRLRCHGARSWVAPGARHAAPLLAWTAFNLWGSGAAPAAALSVTGAHGWRPPVSVDLSSAAACTTCPGASSRRRGRRRVATSPPLPAVLDRLYLRVASARPVCSGNRPLLQQRGGTSCGCAVLGALRRGWLVNAGVSLPRRSRHRLRWRGAPLLVTASGRPAAPPSLRVPHLRVRHRAAGGGAVFRRGWQVVTGCDVRLLCGARYVMRVAWMWGEQGQRWAVAPASAGCAMARDLGVGVVCVGRVRTPEGVGCTSEGSRGVGAVGCVTNLGGERQAVETRGVAQLAPFWMPGECGGRRPPRYI